MSDNHQVLTSTKAAALILEQALAAGLPAPYDVAATDYGPVKFQVHGRDAVQAWAEWIDLDAEVLTRTVESGHIHHTFDGLLFDQLLRVVAVDTPAEVSA